jgi:hypothetical protein
VWTKVFVPVTFADYQDPDNNWTFETFGVEPAPAVAYATIFENVGNVQILAESEGATTANFSIDDVTLAPEPASLALAAFAAPVLLGRRRRNGGKQA